MLVAFPQDDLLVAYVEMHEPAAHAEGLLFPRIAVNRRMPVLGAHLSREHHELLRADAIGVHVDDDLEALAFQVAEPEVGDLDRVTLGGREHDPRLREHCRCPFARAGGVHYRTRTASPLSALA